MLIYAAGALACRQVFKNYSTYKCSKAHWKLICDVVPYSAIPAAAFLLQPLGSEVHTQQENIPERF